MKVDFWVVLELIVGFLMLPKFIKELLIGGFLIGAALMRAGLIGVTFRVQ